MIDHQININVHSYVFKASINFHPRHYTTVGCVESNHYVFYSDKEEQSCHCSLEESEQHYGTMNRVKTPFEEFATVLLYELQMHS